MPKLTAAQTFELARQFNEVAQKLGAYRFANWSKLTPGQRTNLENQEWTIRNYSSDFVALSIKLDVADVAQTLTGIKRGTDRMKAAVKNLEQIAKIIKVATIMISIGAAVTTGNPTVIAAAVSEAMK